MIILKMRLIPPLHIHLQMRSSPMTYITILPHKFNLSCLTSLTQPCTSANVLHPMGRIEIIHAKI